MPQPPENPQPSEALIEAGCPASSTPPAEGERRAQRGYGRQYQSSAAAIYAALDRGDLLWVGLADRAAGIADDLVLGFAGRVIGHQFKASQFPGQFTLRTLLMGASGLLKPLANAWQSLKSANPNDTIEILLVTNDFPSTRDTVGTLPADHSAAFLAEFEQHPERGLIEWLTTRWQPFIDALYQASGLDEPTFEQFLQGFRLLHGSAADFVQLHRLSSEGARLAAEIAKLLPQLVADRRDKDRWTRVELLRELKWRDSAVIRHRSRMFIERWGGLAAFGKAATNQVQANLRRLDMRMSFWRPHVMVAARALRYVAGELRRAGMIASNEAPYLLHQMNFPVPTLPLITPVPRPKFIPRPALEEGNWKDRDAWEKWVQGVESVARPLPIPNEKLIAEISIFKIHQVRRARYVQERIRAPFLNVGDQDDLAEWAGMLPKAMWANGFRTVTNELAATIVRRLYVSYMPEVPPYQLIICPNWLHRLGWRNHPDNWLLYLDHSGQMVARIVWWRDGGAVDVEDDAIWGEGVYITVTTQGLEQIEGISGRVSVLVHAHRKVEPEGSDSEPLSTRVSGRD